MRFRKPNKNTVYLWVTSAFLLVLLSQCSLLVNLKQLSQFQNSGYFPQDTCSGAWLEYAGEYPVVHLSGSPREMGTQYGTLLKPQLRSLFSIFEKVFSEKQINEYLKLASEAGPSLPGEVRDEIKAIADVSGINYDLLIAMNVGTKVDCSTLAANGDATPDGKLIMGRNADYKTKGLNRVLGLIVVRHPEHGLKTAMVSYIGLVGGFSGINEKGVSFGNMLSYNGKDSLENVKGLPVQLLLRLAGEASSNSEEFIDYLSGKEFMISNIVMVADSEKALISEHSQTDSDVRESDRGILASTNFFHSSRLASNIKPDNRFSIIMDEVRKNYGNISVEQMKSIMYKARKKKHRNVQCLVIEPSEMLLHVCINKIPASKGPFTTIDARKLFEQ